jgi:dimethylglycine dehydrogenase
VFGASNGWETPVWFAPDGVEPRDRYSFRRSNYFPHVGNEVAAVREAAGLIDMTAMAKFEVEGERAVPWLDHLLANHLPSRPGGIRLCHMLTERGTVAGEFTVVRLGSARFYLIGSPRAEALYDDMLTKLLPEDRSVRLRNATLERGCFTVVGPRAREILQDMSGTSLANESFPWLTAQSSTVALAPDVRMLRINFEGELGWELYHPIAYQLHLFDAIMEAGRPHGLKLVGNRAIDALRLEKSYRNVWRDINGEHTALESGLDRFIALDKAEFVGQAAVLRQKETGISRRLVTLRIHPAGEAEAMGNEGLYSNGELVGRITSANHAHHLGFNIGLGYVAQRFAKAGTSLQLQILEDMARVEVIADSPHDPDGTRSRA